MQASFNLSNQQDVNSGLNHHIQLTDQEIFYERLRARHPEAFQALYKQYAAAIFGIVLRKVADAETAETILEKIFIEVWNSISAYDEGKMKIFTWLHQMANAQIKYHHLNG